MQRGWRVLILLAVVLGSSAFALGFSVRGAVRYDLGLNKLGLEGELEYADPLDANLTWGVRLSTRAIPWDAPLVLIVPNGFIEYRTTLKESAELSSRAYARAEVGLGWLPQFFPRLVLLGGIDNRYAEFLGLKDVFVQSKLSLDFIPTERLTPGLETRLGLIVIPFVPYLAAGLDYNFVNSTLSPKLFAGSLLFLSPQFFLGLEGGLDPNGFVRLFFQFAER
ncbi:MAG: hypothetical protein N2318_01750 [Meiothermus sp.]|nr:hypothetical protein [Meiothermus sp.]